MRRGIVTLTLLLLGIGFAAPVLVSAQDANSAKITAPRSGDTLFGNVSIVGTASNANMVRYILQWDSQDNDVENWFTVAGPITQQVKDSVLGQWNTTALPDGRYQIRLRVVLRDGTVLSDVVQNLRVANKQPTPLPTLPPTTAPTVPPTAGASPTPFIQQPPTSTPRPVLPTTAPTLVPPADSGPDTPQVMVAIEVLQNAFCSGIYLAFAGFALYGLYRLVFVRARTALRRFFRATQDG